MKTQVYLDNNATTPTRPEAVKAMQPFYNKVYGNASSIHRMGQDARKAVDEAREIIGAFLGTEAVDIIFTSGGTESDNLAIKGAAFANKARGNHIITSKVEHLAVLQACNFLEKNGFDVTYLGVDKYGMVNPDDLKNAITDKTILVTIMHANNEVGTIQPIADLVKAAKAINPKIYFHTDSVQSFGKIPTDVEALGVDLLSISAHKIYGPKGIGALYIRKGTAIIAQQHGGHHERTLRAGTENTPAIAGFAEAVEFAKAEFHKNEEVRLLRDELFEGLKNKIKDIYLNGHPQMRLPNTLNVSFGSIEGESLLVNFDIKGILASAGSACTSGSIEPSHVLKAMNVGGPLLKSAVRFSLGIYNTRQQIDYCIKEVPVIVATLKKYNK